MKWFSKLLIALSVLLLIAGIAGIGYALHARRQSVEYQFQVDALLSAAAIANEEEVFTDPEHAVIAEHEGSRYVIVPGNYRALIYYLKKDAMMPILGRVDKTAALHISVCGLGSFWAVPTDDSGEHILVRLETGGQTLTMHCRGWKLWTDLVACCTGGTYHDDNIPL